MRAGPCLFNLYCFHLFVEVLLTFGVMFGMMYFRTSTLRKGETRS